MDIYMGADWSAKEIVCALRVGEGGKLAKRTARRSMKSIRELLAWARVQAGEGAVIHVVIESGAEGWVQLLHTAGAIVHVVNTAKAAAYAASRCSSHAKDDTRDADNLGSLGRSPEHCPPPWEPEDDSVRELVELSGLHETLTADGVCWEQRLRALLREQFPAVEAVIKDLSCLWVQAFLQAVPTPWHARRLSEPELLKALADCGARAKAKEQILAAVAESSETWLTEATANACASKVRMYVEHIALHTRQLKEVEHQLDACTAKFKFREQLVAIDGIGVKMSSRLLRFALREPPESRDEAAILLGAAPIFHGSARDAKGKVKGHVVMRKSVHPYARSTAYLLGRLAARHLDWAAAMYAAGRARGQTAATAYRRVARSMLRILSAMAISGEPYDDARYVAGLKAKGVPWAEGLAA